MSTVNIWLNLIDYDNVSGNRVGNVFFTSQSTVGLTLSEALEYHLDILEGSWHANAPENSSSTNSWGSALYNGNTYIIKKGNDYRTDGKVGQTGDLDTFNFNSYYWYTGDFDVLGESLASSRTGVDNEEIMSISLNFTDEQVTNLHNNNYYSGSGTLFDTNPRITLKSGYNGSTGWKIKFHIGLSTPICFRGDTQVKTSDGYKNIENLKRGDMVMTNAGAQPLAKLSKGLPTSMIKIPKDLLAKNVPNRDVIVCPWHPLSVKILTSDDDDEPEFLHMLAGELEIFDEVKKVDEGNAAYNLILDKHHEVDVGGMKFLSHHPNHDDGKHPRLAEGEEIDASKRAKKVYVSKDGIFVNYKGTTIKKLLAEMLKFN